MKQLLCTALFAMISTLLLCQSKVNESRQTISARQFQEYDPPTGAPRMNAAVAPAAATPTTQSIPGGSRFTITDETTLPNYYIIYFWEWDDDAAKRALFNYEAGGTISIKYFILLKSQLDVVSEKIYRLFSPTVGALAFPFKYRPQNGKFEPTFNIGIAGGVTWNPFRLNEHTFSLLFGVSSSSARVDQYNTDPAANITDVSERTSVTISANFLYQWERLQIGISMGWDNILDNEILKWKYQGKKWFSFGVGVNLFSASEIKNPGNNK